MPINIELFQYYGVLVIQGILNKTYQVHILPKKSKKNVDIFALWHSLHDY